MKRPNKRAALSPLEITVGRVTLKIYRDLLPSGNVRHRLDNRRLTGRHETYKTEQEAIEAAERLGRRIEAGETKAAELTDKQAMEYILATDAMRPFGLTVGDSTGWMAQALRKMGNVHKLSEALVFYEANHANVKGITVSELVDIFIARKKGERHSKTLRTTLGRFAKSFGCNIGDITTPQIQTYLDKCNFESEVTYHNHWRQINSLFRYAARQDYVLKNAADKVERVDLGDCDVGIYSPEEISKLLGAAPPEYLPSLAIGAFAGLRSAERERLDWSCVHWEGKEFFLERSVTKTGYARTVPIHDNLLAWLTPFKGSTGKVWKGSHDAFYDAQQETASKAKVEWVHNGLRHSYGTYRYRVLNGDVSKVAAEMGNTRAMVEKHYKRLCQPSVAAAWFAVQPEKAENIVLLAATE